MEAEAIATAIFTGALINDEAKNVVHTSWRSLELGCLNPCYYLIPTSKPSFEPNPEAESPPQVEGVFSGTLSYIFNSFVEGTSFSGIVAEAKAAGFTEPDPRDDLAGMDVARKVTILAR